MPDMAATLDAPAPARRASPGATSVRGTRSALRAVFAAVGGIRHPLVLIDGPSGAGKSTFADVLCASWPGGDAALVRLDDVYPGWQGLERGRSMLARTLVPAMRRGAVGSWRRWDWARATPGALERQRPGRTLIVEGCGAFGVGDGRPGEVRVWVDAPGAHRKRRALDRDDGAYDRFWELWERQWRRYVHRNRPARRAHVRVAAVPDVHARGVRTTVEA